MTPQTTPGQGTIIYCIARASSLADGSAIRARGLADSGIRLIPHREIVAVVGDAETEHYQASRRNIKAHLEVIDEVMEASDVVPLRFGEVAPNDEELRRLLLEKQYDGLVHGLDRVHDRVELAVRVSFDEAKMLDEIRASHPDLVKAGGGALSYEDRVTLGQNVAQVIDEKRKDEAERLLAELRPLANEVVTGEPTTDLMTLNASFLVDRARVEEFDQRVRDLGEREAGRLQFKYIGPLPPYSFVDLHIPAESEVEAAHA